MADFRPLIIHRGETLNTIIRWFGEEVAYTPITHITQSAPVLVTAPGHGIVDNWPCAIVGVKGMREINAEDDPPGRFDYHPARYIDDDTLAFNINASRYRAYASGGYIGYTAPVPLAGYRARMAVKRKAGDEELLRLDSDNGGITVSPKRWHTSLYIPADVTTAIDWRRGVYDLEMFREVDGVEYVHRLLQGPVLVDPDWREVTT